jgi:hypothetical protein
MPRYGDPIEVTLRLRPDIARNGFLRRCYDEWVDDVAYYKEHPEIKCDPGYLRTCSFEEYVVDIARSRADELVPYADAGGGFKIEVVRRA